MRVKLIGFAIALLSVATIGVVQLNAEAAQDGKVGNAPRCTVKAVGERNQAFTITGNKAKVKFVVSGKNNCKVQLSTASFYSPSADGKPYNQQELYERKTRIIKGPGNYSMTATVPPQAKAKGCFNQIDLHYGVKITSKVIAFNHKPYSCANAAATCDSLEVNKQGRTKFSLRANASVENAAKVKGYDFVVKKDGKVVDRKSVDTNKWTAWWNYKQTAPGDYTAQVTVRTTEGKKTGAACTKPFTVTPPETPEENPAITIDKKVNNQESDTVAVGEEFNYQIVVKNTGDVDLKDAKVTDTPADDNIVLNSTQAMGEVVGNVWTYTIPELKVGESKSFVLTATISEYKAGNMVNNVCVDTPTIPGGPDDCDEVPVITPETPVYTCDSLTVAPLSDNQYRFDASYTVENAEYVRTTYVVTNSEGEEVYRGSDNTYTQTTPGVYTVKASIIVNVDGEAKSVTGPNCTATFTVPEEEVEMVEVCDPETGDTITVPKTDEDNYPPVDSEKCDTAEVCDPETGNIVTVPKTDEDQYDSANSENCVDTPETPETPGEEPAITELPTTGPAETVAQLISAVSLAGAGTYYLASRRGQL